MNTSTIQQQLHILKRYIEALEAQQGMTEEKFTNDFLAQLAVERAFQAGVEACTDVAKHIVSVRQLGHPHEDRDVYWFLVKGGYLEQGFGQAMMTLVTFGHQLAHLYWDIDLNRLYQALQDDVNLLTHFCEFAQKILDNETK